MTQALVAKADWQPLLEAAGIDLSKSNFSPVVPEGSPPVYADERAAWEGTFTDYTSIKEEMVRVEAASAYQGRPVYFAIIGSWPEERLSPKTRRKF